jgi:hypothetical protein
MDERRNFGFRRSMVHLYWEKPKKTSEKHQENHLEQAPVQEKSLKMDIPPVMAILLKKS